MAQRISRAKQTIRASGIPFEPPERRARAERLDTVLHVLYLIFNEGYTASSGASLQRLDLAAEAIRLTRAVRQLMPDDAEASGLLALMLLTHARRDARTGPAGELVPLPQQDRSRWDRAAIEEGVALLTATLSQGRVGPYQLQAAVAAVHDEAPSHDSTDWAQIAALYGLLERMSDNPMVTLNRAIAVAMVQGPAAGLALVDALAAGGRLAGSHRLDAVRGHLLELAGESRRRRDGLSGGGQPHHQHRRAQLPAHAGSGAPRRRRALAQRLARSAAPLARPASPRALARAPHTLSEHRVRVGRAAVASPRPALRPDGRRPDSRAALSATRRTRDRHRLDARLPPLASTGLSAAGSTALENAVWCGSRNGRGSDAPRGRGVTYRDRWSPARRGARRSWSHDRNEPARRGELADPADRCRHLLHHGTRTRATGRAGARRERAAPRLAEQRPHQPDGALCGLARSLRGSRPRHPRRLGPHARRRSPEPVDVHRRAAPRSSVSTSTSRAAIGTSRGSRSTASTPRATSRRSTPSGSSRRTPRARTRGRASSSTPT